jgi:hypothetical protein
MRKILILVAAIAASAALPAAAVAGNSDTPFPSPTVKQVFIAAQTVTTQRALITQVAPGSTVVFRAYAVDGKTRNLIAAKGVKYFYVKIPGQPNVKLKFDAKAPGASARMPWTGAWAVPADYPLGSVEFKILIKLEAKRYGQFVQFPVASSQLTVTKTTTTSLSNPVAADPAVLTDGKLDAALYVDSVNGTRPAGTTPRPVGCTQTNVFKRGEQFVLRTWGSDLATGNVLSTENVDTATFKVPGVAAPIILNWGAHGATSNRVWFWTNAWNIPTDFPLGDATIRVAITLDSGKVATYDYAITIIP